MHDWGWLGAIWDLLGRDMALVGGFQSPLLSWLGAGGIILLCLWHSVSLIRGTLELRQACARLHSTVARLASARHRASQEWLTLPHLAKKQMQQAEAQGARRDLDDLQELDRVMRAEQTFADDWLSYRKTFVVEQPAWFLEPTVSTERSAADHLSFAALCATRLNVRFYQQLPSFLTGVGLMFTFLGILIGLSKLHANGSQIEGIQGLINGLAGKFVTSVVGLACAMALRFWKSRYGTGSPNIIAAWCRFSTRCFLRKYKTGATLCHKAHPFRSAVPCRTTRRISWSRQFISAWAQRFRPSHRFPNPSRRWAANRAG
jgi:biopolymer transport protein ExbB/TolQ